MLSSTRRSGGPLKVRRAIGIRASVLFGVGLCITGSCKSDQELFEGDPAERRKIGAVCVSDRQCSDEGLFCDARMGCVECRETADCTAGRACVSGRCEKVVSCRDSRVCGGRVCSTSDGVCVDCFADTDCLVEGERCVSGVCTRQTVSPASPGVGGESAGGPVENQGAAGGALVEGGGANSAAAGGGGLGGGGVSGGFVAGAGGLDAANSDGKGGASGLSECTPASLIAPVRATPTVLWAVEGSSSMFKSSKGWELVDRALMHPDDGVIAKYQHTIRFGFSVYEGRSEASFGSVGACTEIGSVGAALNNHGAIDFFASGLDERLGSDGSRSAPTGEAFERFSEDLSALAVDPRYVILVIASDPNTCDVTDIQCGQDDAIAAVQAGYANGIRTLVVGTGQSLRACDDSVRRCGRSHLEDLANAGLGLPVQAPPPAYWTLPCAAGGPKSSFADSGTSPGVAEYYGGTSESSLRDVLSQVIENVVDCSYDLNGIVESEPGTGQVVLGNTALELDAPNGYRLEASRRQITLTGTACAAARAGQALLVSFSCFRPASR